jgi:hypothetical protein
MMVRMPRAKVRMRPLRWRRLRSRMRIMGNGSRKTGRVSKFSVEALDMNVIRT